jgi:hypothetical protein
MNRASEDLPFRWSMVADSLRRPYPVMLPMVVLLRLAPALALVTIGIVAAGVAGFWALYRWQA